MRIAWIEITDFRSYPRLRFQPESGLNVLVGPNGQGKTNLLEALGVLLAGRSFRTPRLAELPARGAERALVRGELVRGEVGRTVQLAVERRGPRAELEGEVCPWGRAVAFGAGDLGILTGPPQARRGWLDAFAGKLYPAHLAALGRYRAAPHQRGRLLEQRGVRPSALAPWDEQLAELGSAVLWRRQRALEALRAELAGLDRLAGLLPGPVEVSYLPTVPLEADPARQREVFGAALERRRGEELVRGQTLVGPHRDDLLIRLGGVDARAFASRGEQRGLALLLRLAEAGPIRRETGSAPVLLLDDPLSELDVASRSRVLTWLEAQEQALLSAPDGIALPTADAVVWEVAGGEVAPLLPAASGGGA